MTQLDDFVGALAWSPTQQQIAAATLAGPVKVLDADRGHPLQTFAKHSQGSLAVAWSPDGEYLASGGQDGLITLGHSDGSSRVLDGGGAWVEHLAWSPRGEWLASAAGKSVRLWGRDGALAYEVTGFGSSITSLFWMPQSGQLVTSCYGGLQFIEVGKKEWTRRLDWKGSILTAAPSPDGRFIATGNQDASVHVWEVKSGKDLQMTGYALKVRELAWQEEGPVLATGGGGAITLWSFAGAGPAGKPPEELTGHEERITGLAFAGARLISASEDRTLRVWERRKGWKCARVETADVPLGRLAVSPSGTRAATAGSGGAVMVWDLDDGQ